MATKQTNKQKKYIYMHQTVLLFLIPYVQMDRYFQYLKILVKKGMHNLKSWRGIVLYNQNTKPKTINEK